ncbi:MAG: endolytic transglycosylase MltG [Ottowia sp.]|nr:endolytic transglycosylase MltG [Ottowia sp.]
MRRLLLFLLLLLVLGAALAGAAAWWSQQPLALQGQRVEFDLPRGTSVRGAAKRIEAAGVKVPAEWLHLYFRWAGRKQTIKSGEYEVSQGTTPAGLLRKLVRGEHIVRTVTLVEGWTFEQVRSALARADRLVQRTADLSNAEIMSALGQAGVNPEGRFFPDTYHYTSDTSDLDVLRQAMNAMSQKLSAAWQQRQPDLPLHSPEEALILASIVEKETGLAADRAEIAGVFVNRLRRDMPLQTDPTVIYGVGKSFDGRLTRSQLRADTPYNTYTRKGLPPTPIALPGQAALVAVVQPAQTRSLYFVSRGDGSSHFSTTLNEHNRAVNKYQRGKGAQ